MAIFLIYINTKPRGEFNLVLSAQVGRGRMALMEIDRGPRLVRNLIEGFIDGCVPVIGDYETVCGLNHFALRRRTDSGLYRGSRWRIVRAGACPLSVSWTISAFPVLNSCRITLQQVGIA